MIKQCLKKEGYTLAFKKGSTWIPSTEHLKHPLVGQLKNPQESTCHCKLSVVVWIQTALTTSTAGEDLKVTMASCGLDVLE